MTSTTAGLSSHRPVRERGWRDRAACRGTNPELFFPVGDDGPARRQIAEAKRVCANCPARAICLEEALSSGEDEGIFGGHTPTERRALKRHARNAARTPAGPEAIPATSTGTELARSDHVQVQRLIAAALAQQQDLPEVTSGEAALAALTLVTRHRWTRNMTAQRLRVSIRTVTRWIEQLQATQATAQPPSVQPRAASRPDAALDVEGAA